MEDIVKDLINAGISVELLVPAPKDQVDVVGIRLHPYGKGMPKDKMILGVGPTFAEALNDAVEKAHAKRWEHLSWSKRPWAVLPSWAAETAAALGLV